VDAFTLSLTLGLFILAVLAFFGFKEYPQLRDFLSDCRSTFSRHWVAARHRSARRRQGEHLPSTFTNRIGMEFVLIPAGTFMMGTPVDQLDAIAGEDASYRDLIEHEAPQHQIVISQPFCLGKYPVTQAQWQTVMETNPSEIKGANRPVENVSWADAQAFMQKLNDLEGDSRHYRLPTEAEWEYACRAGSNTLYYFGDDESQLGEYAWYGGSLDGHPQPVGQREPNTWGLHDMLGNVWEWCRDWYDKSYYQKSTAVDPQGPDAGANRVIRGGVWASPAQHVRAAFRGWRSPGGHQGVGFRCASSGTRR
jgi:formylglycine-generating enzyme required for sulfatase activity